MANRQDPNRFSDAEVVVQKAAVLRARMAGATWDNIAISLTKESPDGQPVDASTARRRYESAIQAYEVPRSEWDRYRNNQLAQIELALEKVMASVLTWNPRTDDASSLTGPLGLLVRLQERADRVIGFPEDPPPPPPASNDARSYVLNIVSNPVAHAAMLGAMRSIEEEVIQAEIVEEEE